MSTKAEIMQMLHSRLMERQSVLQELATQLAEALKLIPRLREQLRVETAQFNEAFGSELLDPEVKEQVERALGLSSELFNQYPSSESSTVSQQKGVKTARVVSSNKASAISPHIDRIALSHPEGTEFTYKDVCAKLKRQKIAHHRDWVSTRLSRLKHQGKLIAVRQEANKGGQRPLTVYSTSTVQKKDQGPAPLNPELNISAETRLIIDEEAGSKGLRAREIWDHLQARGALPTKRGTMSVALVAIARRPEYERTKSGRYRRK